MHKLISLGSISKERQIPVRFPVKDSALSNV